MGEGGGTGKGGGKHMSGQWDGQKKWEMDDEVVQCREEANKHNASVGTGILASLSIE